jgi:hypothetical protein
MGGVPALRAGAAVRRVGRDGQRYKEKEYDSET